MAMRASAPRRPISEAFAGVKLGALVARFMGKTYAERRKESMGDFWDVFFEIHLPLLLWIF